MPGNDSDPHGDRLFLTEVTQPANGSVGLFNGPFVGQVQYVRYTPNTGFAGTDTFTNTVSDGARAQPR